MSPRPRLAFLGLGWIGRHRMEAVAAEGIAEIVALSDPSPEALEAAARHAPGAAWCDGLEELLAACPDGVVIATPSALHAEQAVAALEAGAAVFCQKPLGRTAAEARTCVDAARAADRLLAADLSYRHAAAFQALREAVSAGDLGPVHALDLTFHNAYGPDKPWFRDRTLSGGGCLIDLGVHLIDTALWALNARDLRCVSAHLYAGGVRMGGNAIARAVEDYAAATFETPEGAVIRIACSWNLPAGQDAVIGVDAFGPNGGFSVRNEGGSFYDFSAHRHRGTASERRVTPPDAWGGRAVVHWARRLSMSVRYDSACEGLVDLAMAIDAAYARAAQGVPRHPRSRSAETGRTHRSAGRP
jgi:predicted dehydrogenase